MVCLACRLPGPPLCGSCRSTVHPLGDLRTPGGLTVVAWAEHRGAARVLVRRLKYEGVVAVASLVAEELASRVPADARWLVPVPRTLTRRVRYGVDQATEIAAALSRRTGVPVVSALGAPVWARPHAGSARADRTPPRLTTRRRVEGAVLVDDVLTTGSTLDRAASLLGVVESALTVTGVP